MWSDEWLSLIRAGQSRPDSTLFETKAIKAIRWLKRCDAVEQASLREARWLNDLFIFRSAAAKQLVVFILACPNQRLMSTRHRRILLG